MLRCAPTAGAHPVLMSTLAGTSASPDQRAALLWAAVVGWIGALALAAFAALWWAVASMLVVVAEALHPEVDPSPDPSGLVVGTAVAMLLCVAVALGASWVTARAPGGHCRRPSSVSVRASSADWSGWGSCASCWASTPRTCCPDPAGCPAGCHCRPCLPGVGVVGTPGMAE